MEILTSEEVRSRGLPAGTHVVELVGDTSECATHPHFAGMECVPVGNIRTVTERFGRSEPILIHCDLPERCDMALTELERLGYTNVYRYEGRLEEIEPVMAGWAAPELAAPIITRDALDALLRERGDAVSLFMVVRDSSECPTMQMGVTCVEERELEAEGLEGLNLDNTIVLKCGAGVNCQAIARRVFDAGFGDVRIFEGDYKDISWYARM